MRSFLFKEIAVPFDKQGYSVSMFKALRGYFFFIQLGCLGTF